MKNKKRLLALLLVVATLLSVLPMTALALDEPEEPASVVEVLPEEAVEPEAEEPTEVPEEEPAEEPVEIPEEEPAEVPEEELEGEVEEEEEVFEIPDMVNPLYASQYSVEDMRAFAEQEAAINGVTEAKSATTYNSIQEAGNGMRAFMKNRGSSRNISFTFTVKNCKYASDGFFDILELAVKHTGVPTEGDYILVNWYGYQDVSYKSAGTNAYTYTGTLMMWTTASDEANMNTLVKNWLSSHSSITSGNDLTKINETYRWICDNITYDYTHLNDMSYGYQQTPYAGLKYKTCVCQGYSGLFYRFMMEMGVDARVVCSDDHAWNIVKWGNRYWNLDATWDAGTSYNDYNYFMHTNTGYFNNEHPRSDFLVVEYGYDFNQQYPMTEVYFARGDWHFTGRRTICASNPDDLSSLYLYDGTGSVASGWQMLNGAWYYFDPANDGKMSFGEVEIDGEVCVFDENGILQSKMPVDPDEGGEDPSPDSETSGYCGPNLTWSVDEDGVLTISGTGEMTDYTYGSPAPWGKDIKSVVIEKGVTSIGDYAFQCCEGLTSVTIPNSVTSIGEGAFGYCTSLTSVTIPNSVTSIGGYAFGGCTSLTKISVASGNPNYCGVGGVLFNKDKTELIQYPGGKAGAYTIPNSVTSIGDWAFQNCMDLTSVTIPNSVTSIGSEAFQGCTSLTSVTIPNSVTSIGSYAFYNCTNLTSVTIPNSVTSIGDWAFGGCTSLTSVTIPNSVTSIGGAAFAGCTSLTSVTIGNSVTSIGERAFYNCTSLTSVTIPNSVTSIGWYAFAGCTGLKTVGFEGDAPEMENDLFYGATLNAYYPKNNATWTADVMQDYGGTVTWIAGTAPAPQPEPEKQGWIQENGHWYYYENGKAVTGWKAVSGKWYYFNTSGVMQTGWLSDGGKWYYMNGSGAMVTGWVSDGGKWYYMNGSGVMQTGWVSDGGKWYYMNGSGAMVTGWVSDGGKWYYMNGSGAMVAKDWVSDGGKWYYMNGSGAMVAKEWVSSGSKWYYMNGSGAMVTNEWVYSGGKWYYMDAEGVMVTNKTLTIGGKDYSFDGNGVCTNP